MAENTPAQSLRAVPVPRTPVPLWSRRVAGIPAAGGPLLGRQRELAALRNLVRSPGCRLITLTGPGGSGKTRLALAAEIEDDFADGAMFVPLAAVADPALVLQAIARVLDVRDTAERTPLDAVASALRDRRILLVLDNFQHVVATAVEIAALLEMCPATTVVVTSRSPLHLHGEQQFATPPLALPESSAADSPESGIGFGAVALFVERARWVRNDFSLHAGNAAAVAEVCRRLDGVPLAIELAAAWMHVLSPAALLERMEQRLPWLREGSSDRPARLRTMQNAITWSHDLLTPDEGTLFRRLAIFVGGFDLEGVVAVWKMAPAGEDGDTAAAVIDVLAGLIDKSLLLRVDAHEPAPRFAMLETIREFALGRLAASGEAEALEAVRADRVLALAERADPEMMDSQQAVWLALQRPRRPSQDSTTSSHGTLT